MATETSTQTETKQAVMYLRVSSAQQADKDFDKEGFSIPAQREACQREADKLGALIVPEGEYIDRGESAKTTKRPALRAMLARIERGDIDYVIVHKVDRLARNRADDIEIVMAIRKAGAQLVSVTENIDETPSGLLMHGIMSSIAEFYSRNLAAEVIKGSTQKAKRGGTPFRAPIGYLHGRADVDGREVRIVVLDPERAPLVRATFTLYASGDFALSELAAIMEERGLRSRPTRKFPERTLKAKDLQKLLRNPYYMGIVSYAGKVYPGRHEPLVDEEIFQQVQDLLTSKKVSGERAWRHFHYLRGSLYCRECGCRLMFTQAKGKSGGTYDYFVCPGRQHADCTQPHHRVEAVEAAVEQHYATVRLSEADRCRVRAAVHAHVTAIKTQTAEQASESERKLLDLDAAEQKLLTKYYDDRVSEALFDKEQDRISRERVAANRQIERLSVKHDQILDRLDQALALTDDIQRAYVNANPQERRLLNQAFFERLEIDTEEVGNARLAAPFQQLQVVARSPWETATATLLEEGHESQESRTQTSPELALAARTPGSLSKVGGSYVGSLVPLRGFEPRFPD
jgi:site-specific DNA recombinase